MNREELSKLAQRILTKNASDAEVADYISRFNRAQGIEYEVDENWEENKAYILRQILRDIKPKQGITRRLFIRIAAAAAIIIGIGVAALLNFNSRTPTNETTGVLKNDFKPGSNKAILTLSNGRRIVLDNSGKNILANESGVLVKKNSKGELVYDASLSKDNNSTIQYNTITTPRGASHQIILPDGTHVWLNAASSLTYPIAFKGSNRTVELTGEGYFEVTKDKLKPFRVKTALQTIEVLGTHFNINAYPDEANTATTLLEGSVKVNSGINEAVLAPGQESFTGSQNTKITIEKNVDVDMVIAWKNNEFNFNNSDTKAILRQVSRWYDVDIEYRSEVPNYRLDAEISRNVNASEVLKILDYTGLKFKIEGRKIIVQ